MKINYLLLSILSIFFINNSYAVCAFGTIDQAVWGTPDDFTFGFTSDANTTDVDTVQVVQGEDTTIFIQYLLPKLQAITSPITGTATVTSVQIIGVTGLPIGMDWILDAAANGANNTYYPQTYRYGTVTLCGTTFTTPGIKTIIVTVNGCGSLGGISDCQNQTIPLYIEVLAGAGGNSAFTFTPPVGCNNMDVDFEAIFQSTDPVLYPVDFNWNFGDGSTGTGTNITAHNYSTPGVYPVKLDVLINEFYISSASVIISGGWYPDIEELTVLSTPEPYIIINGIQTSSGSGTSASWTLDIPLTSTTINAQTKEEDTGGLFGSADDDLGSGSTVIIPSDGGNFGITTTHSNIIFTVHKRLAQIVTFWDTVYVYSNSVGTITSNNGTSFCSGDSTILDLGSTAYDFIQWYNDTTIIIGETNPTLTVMTDGNYHAEVLEQGNICAGNSNSIMIAVDVVSSPVITQNGTSLEVDNTNGYDVQWFSNGVPIPGATSDILTDLSSGNPFSALFTNTNGCEAPSSSFSALISGTSTQTGALIANGTDITFDASGFSLCPGQEIAWAVSTDADGPITDMTGLQDAIDADWVYQSSSLNSFDASCSNTTFPPGDYYMTPVSVNTPVSVPVYWNANTDSNYCDANMELCIGLTGTDWIVDSITIDLPNGTRIDVICELAPALCGTQINPALWQIALGQAGGGSTLCLDFIDLLAYYDDPNGDWVITVINSGTGALDFSIDDFNITVESSTCDSLATDQVTVVSGVNGNIPPTNTHQSFTIIIPPISGNFPEVTAACLLFGDATTFSSTCVNGIEDIVDIENINLYPNPNNGLFHLDFILKESSQVEIAILDLTGRKVLHRTYLNENGKFSETFDLKNNLKSGFYILDIQIGEEHTQKKFIVNN